ncbi:rod shape-determining protein MreD [Parasediminibacterium sp. JCM 36343]|uniref:rod shape-determining protein MreD n=1 Tax=Parasediminibacterium sp. JCM 36343 TaxID=3374279 RepID=UPI00397C3D09
MTSLLKNIIRFILFILVQVYVLDKVPPLHQFIVPYLYFLFILWLPFTINRVLLLAIAFAFGLSLDYFTGTLGLHAAPCVLIAYLRPFILNFIIRQESNELSYTDPSIKSMGFTLYALYVALLTFIHHLYLVVIEWLQFGDVLYLLGKVMGTTAISLLLIGITEMLLYRKGTFKTNAG